MTAPAPGGAPTAPPTLREAWPVWARIGLQSFGGPAAQIALMHRVLVAERRWLDEATYTRALGFCMLLPGPEAMQLATYAGWRLHGVAGGMVAGAWFVLPGALLLTGLAALYARFGHVPASGAVLLGIQAAALVLVIQALARLSPRVLKRRAHLALAASAFLALSAFAIPFPFVIAAAAVAGAWLPPADTPAAGPAGAAAPPGAWRRSWRAALVWGALWIVPLATLAALAGANHILTRLAWFFSKLAVVTFGGAYAVLSYMAQDIVTRHGWLEARQMVEALGLAETTPGPLILVNLFVGSLAAANAHPDRAFALGLAGAAVALWATFVPCFLWVFAGAPHVERLAAAPRLRGALEGITAAVHGVIANLGLWFGMHVLFARVAPARRGALHWNQPDLATLDGRALLLTVLCAGILLGLRWSVHRTLVVAVLLAWALSWGGSNQFLDLWGGFTNLSR